MTDLVLDGLAVTRGGRTLLHPLGARIAPGEMVAVVGPNGAGKSTLLRAIAQLVPAAGRAQFGPAALTALSPQARARLVGYLPQAHQVAWPMPVRDMVALGLYAYGTAGHDASGSADIDAMLDLCGIADLADRARKGEGDAGERNEAADDPGDFPALPVEILGDARPIHQKSPVKILITRQGMPATARSSR